MYKPKNDELMMDLATILSIIGLILGIGIIYQLLVFTPGIDAREHSLGHERVISSES